MSLRRFLRKSCRRTFRTSFVISRQFIEDIIAVKLYTLTSCGGLEEKS